MEKFEYTQLVYDCLNSVSRELTKELNRYGNNGWEAFTVRSMSNDRLQIFLKRKIHE